VPMYAHQLGTDGSVGEEHQSKVAAYEPPLKEGEVVTGQELKTTEEVEASAGGKPDQGARPSTLDSSGEQPGAKSSEKKSK
jgi:hypothetical protein